MSCLPCDMLFAHQNLRGIQERGCLHAWLVPFVRTKATLHVPIKINTENKRHKQNNQSKIWLPSPMRTTRPPCQVLKTFSSSITLPIKCLGVRSIKSPSVEARPCFPHGTLKSRTCLHMASAASGPQSELRNDLSAREVSLFRKSITDQQTVFIFVVIVVH